jgi:ribosomal protein S18 acetylase RimI-like enzyme
MQVPEIVYPRDFDTVYVERLRKPLQVEEAHAYAALILLERAYAELFEPPRGEHPRDTFKTVFDSTSNERVVAQKMRMQEYVKNGTTYLFIRDRDIPEFSLKGLAKYSPSRSSAAQKAGFSAPNCYVNDIAVHPDYQSQGFGRILMHTIAKFGGFKPDRYMTLDAFSSDRLTREWYERLGFREVATKEPLVLDLGGAELQQMRYSTEPEATLSHVVGVLEASDPHLKGVSPRNT